jgi:hypothetical protein
VSDYDVVWSGGYLCAADDGPSYSTAALAAAEGDDDDRPAVMILTGRGGRPVGRRFRDAVCELMPAPLHGQPGARRTLAELAATMEFTGPHDLALIARALLTLVQEGRLARELVKRGPGRRRWVYWRVP